MASIEPRPHYSGSTDVNLGIHGQQTHTSAHVAYFWETQKEFTEAVRFLEIGLQGSDYCVIFGHDDANKTVCKLLEERGFDVASLQAASRLAVLGGDNSGERLLQTIGATFSEASSKGAPLVRLLGNIGWGKKNWPEEHDLLVFEAKVTKAAQQFPCVVVCMYDMPALSGHVLHHGGFGTHPYLMFGPGPLRENPNYVSTDRFLERIETIAREIADRKRSDDALKKSEDRFLTLFESAPLGISINNAEGRFIHVNPTFQEMLGYSASELTQFTFKDVTFGDDLAESKQLFGELVQGKRQAFQVEKRYVRKNGSILWAGTRCSAVKDASGNFAYTFAMVADISERKRASEALQKSEERLRMLLEINNAIITKRTRDELFHTISAALRRVIAFDRLALCLHEPELNSLRIVTYAGPYQRTDYSPIGRVLDLNDSPAGWAFSHQKPFLRCDLETERQTSSEERAYGHGFRSLCALPLMVRGKSIGALTVGSLNKFQYTEADANFLMEVAKQIAIAIDNVRSYEEIGDLKARLQAENVYLQEEIKTEHNFEEIIGQSAPVQHLLRKLEQVAPTESTVLIQGETGTGKELLARAVHDRSRRKDRPLVKVNCGTIPSGLVESELFGHEKGAFTGATQRRTGRFELANGGTIFLDEVTELPTDTQVKLLRVLQEGEFERVGSSQTIKVDVRVIAATNRDLKEVVKNGTFRADLFYRLNVVPLEVPPLRERKSDIPLVVNFFLTKFARKLGKEIKGISQRAMETLMSYEWPGNVRELQNVIERAVVLATRAIVHLDESMVRSDGAVQDSTMDTLENVERNHIVRALSEANWVIHGKKGAASVLGINPSTLRSRMEKLGIKKPLPADRSER